MKLTPNITRTAVMVVVGVVTVASIHAAAQQPAPPNTGTQFPKVPGTQLPEVPGAQIPLVPEAWPFRPIPETKEFPKPQWYTLSGQPTFTFHVSPPVRMVCHMVVVPVNPDIDPKILVPVPEDAPKGTMKTVAPPCEPTPARR